MLGKLLGIQRVPHVVRFLLYRHDIYTWAFLSLPKLSRLSLHVKGRKFCTIVSKYLCEGQEPQSTRLDEILLLLLVSDNGPMDEDHTTCMAE
jgi:hypothetical protein